MSAVEQPVARPQAGAQAAPLPLLRRLPRRGVHHAPGALRALARGALAPSGRRAAFEQALAAYSGVAHAVAVGSGRASQALLLRALLERGQLAPGDTVLVPALTFHAVPAAVERAGLRVAYVDVDPADLLTGPDQLAGALDQHRGARALIATHLMGLPADLAGLAALCQQRGLLLIEDLAQAAGARVDGRRVGGLGLAGFTSLETVKPLNAYGGGAVLTDDHDLARRLRLLALDLPAPDAARLARKVALGQVEALLARPLPFALVGWPLFSGDGEGWVARYKQGKQAAGNHHAALTAAQAAAGSACLDHLEEHLAARIRNAERLLGLLPPSAWRPRPRPGDRAVWYQVVVQADDVDGLVQAGRRAGMDLGRGVLTDLSQGACAVAARAARRAVQLPCHPGLGDADLRAVAATVGPWLA